MPEPAHVIVKGVGAPLDPDPEVLRNRELGLLFLAVTKDHEQDECSTAELTADVRRCGMISWRHAEPGARNEGRGRVIDHQRADTGLMRSWLAYCQQNHPQCRLRRARTVVEHFQLIDCTTRSIVAAPAECDYVALSYVWGHGPASSSDAPGSESVLTDLPKTVSDAIVATVRLGYRFLWVDRYCIPNDPRIKHTQISQMNIIYQNAVATVIAIGNDAAHGLAGVGDRTRVRQSSVQLDGITVHATLPHPATAIQASVWMTRGWTYQEAVLSRRRIFFTDQQVYFECNGMQCFETLPPALDEWHTSDKRSFLSLVDRSIFTVPTSSVGLTSLRLFTSEYARRNLSFDLDSLNGFLGILAYLETLNPSFRHWWGLGLTTQFDLHSRPYIEDFVRMTKVRAVRGDAFREARLPGRERAPTTVDPAPNRAPDGKAWFPEHCFLNALLWRHSNAANRRRPGFPSWSWAGWAGALTDVTLTSGYYGCACHPEQRTPRVVCALMDDKSTKPWVELVPLLRSGRMPLLPQPRSFTLEARTIPLNIVEVSSRHEDRLMNDGYYIMKELGSIALLDGLLDECTVYARVHLSNERDFLEHSHEIDQLGYAGIVLGCDGNKGLLVVRPAEGGGCERIGVVDISGGSEFHGVLTELNVMADGENSRLMKHWYSKDGYHSRNCSVFDLGGFVAVSPGGTAVEDWEFDDTVLRSVLR